MNRDTGIKAELRRGDKIVIKPVWQLLEEGWEPSSWGWIDERATAECGAFWESNYYTGIEEILSKDRTLTVVQDDGGREGIHCLETNYHIARKAVGMVLSR